MTKKILTLVLLAPLLIACDFAGDMKEMFEKQELVQKTIKSKYGIESQVAWNMSNGNLTQVTVIFNSADVQSKKVSDLEVMAQEAVTSAFKSKPQYLNVQIAKKND